MGESKQSSKAPGQFSETHSGMASGHIRRISYFMLFRLVILAGFTVLVGVLQYTTSEHHNGMYVTIVWGTIFVGYALTIAYARLLPKVRNLHAFVAVQITLDILLSAIVVHVSGGVDSGLVTLYLISILGAATMAGRNEIWAAAGTCALIYLTMGTLEYGGILIPFAAGEEALSTLDHWSASARTIAGMAGVAALSSYLNRQIAASATQVGDLRALNENIVLSLNSGLVTTDMDGRVLYFNPAAAAILGISTNALGLPVDGIFPGIDVSASQSRGTESRQDLELCVDERTVHIGLTCSPLINAAGEAIGQIINFQDLTKLHELRQKVRRAERLAALGGLAASVAHEIRNPLAAISGSAELLSGTSENDDDRRLLTIIRRESQRLSQLITDLLSFTRPRAPERMHVDAAKAIGQTCESFQMDPLARSIEFKFRGEPDLIIFVDPSQLSQVIWNLMRNAAEAIQGSGKIFVRVYEENERISIEIRDTGMGIPAAQLESIFDPFFTTKETGTGFGLAIVHRVIQDNEGTISASSTPGKGSRFKITFPRPTSSERSDVRALKLAASHPSLGSDDPMPRSKRHGGADRQVE